MHDIKKKLNQMAQSNNDLGVFTANIWLLHVTIPFLGKQLKNKTCQQSTEMVEDKRLSHENKHLVKTKTRMRTVMSYHEPRSSGFMTAHFASSEVICHFLKLTTLYTSLQKTYNPMWGIKKSLLC